MPYRPIVKRTGAAVANIGAQIGQTISDLPAKVAAEKKAKSDEEQRTAYLKAVKEDSSLLDTSYKSLKKTYEAQAKQLVDQGIMTQDEMAANLKSIPMPRETDKLNDESLNNYRNKLGERINQLFVDSTNRAKKQKTEKTISGEMAPKTQVKAGAPVEDPQSMKTMPTGPGPGAGSITETDITERPAEWETTQAAPDTTQKLMENVSKADPSIPAKDVEASTAYGSLQSQEHLDKMAAQEAKTAAKAERDELSRQVDEARLRHYAALDAGIDSNIKKTNKELVLKEDAAKKKFTDSVAKLNTETRKVDDQIAELKKGKKTIRGVEVDWEAIQEQDAKKEAIKMEIDDLKNERKEQGQMPGETRVHKKPTPKPKKTAQPIGEPKLKPRGRTSNDEAAIAWARDMLKKNPKDTIALRILKANKLTE